MDMTSVTGVSSQRQCSLLVRQVGLEGAAQRLVRVERVRAVAVPQVPAAGAEVAKAFEGAAEVDARRHEAVIAHTVLQVGVDLDLRRSAIER